MFIESNGKTLYVKQAFGCEAEPKTELGLGEGIADSVMETVERLGTVLTYPVTQAIMFQS